MKKCVRSALLVGAIALALPTAVCAQNTYQGGTGDDAWNLTASWSLGVVPPTASTTEVVIPAGKSASVKNTVPKHAANVSLGGTLQFKEGGTVGCFNALGTPGTTVISMAGGSRINTRCGNSPIIPAIQLLGNVEYGMGQSTAPSSTPDFNYPITGNYTFKLQGKGGCIADLNAANSFGELAADSQYGSGWVINANVAGSLGGDVTIRSDNIGNICADLHLKNDSALGDAVTLALYGNDSPLLWIDHSGTDTLGGLVLNGVPQPVGTYGKSGSGADYEVSWIAGTGTGLLNVVGTGGPYSYWDIDDSTPGAGGSTPTGTWDGSNAYWNNVDGDGTAATWTPGQTATFAAGTDATGTYTVTVSGTQDINGLNFEEGTVTLSGDGLRMTAASEMAAASGVTGTVSSVISDDGTAWKLTKVGDGTLVLAGNNTYTGVTKLSGGILSVGSLASAGNDSPIGNFASAGNSGLVLASGTFQYTGATASVNRGFTLRGVPTIDVSGTGVALTLGECWSDTCAGTLTVTGGSGSSLSLGRISITDNAHFTLAPSTIPVTVSEVRGYNAYPYGTAWFIMGGTGTGEVTGLMNEVNPPGSGYGQTLGVRKVGSSTWTLSYGSSSYTQPTQVQGGTLIAGANAPYNANGAFGKATSDVELGVANSNDDAAILIGGAYTIGRNIRLKTQNTTDTGTRVLTLGGSTADSSVFSGAIYLGDNSNAGRSVTLTAASGGTVTFSGVIQEPTGMDATTYTVTKAGEGTVVLTAANAYNGSTAVSEGTLSLGNGTSSSSLSDYATLSVASGAVLDLNYSGQDTVLILNLGGSPAAMGTWGATGSGAANIDDTYFSGTGVINNLAGILVNEYLWDGGTENIAGDGDVVSAGGSGTWDTTIKNWDIGYTGHTAWGNTTADKAVFGGASGTVTLGEDLSINALTVSAGVDNYKIGATDEDNVLNFGGTDPTILVGSNTGTIITPGITGSPTINYYPVSGNNNSILTLSPVAPNTMTLGTVNVIRINGNANLALGGDSDSNTVDTVTWTVQSNQLYIKKQGTGTWEIENAFVLDDGRLFVEEGTLICNTSDNIVSHDIEVQSGGRLTGECGFTILDQQEDFYFLNGATMAPGKNGVGTITIGWNSTRTAVAEAQLLTGSTYEWEVGAGNATDTLHVKYNTSTGKAVLLKLENFTLKILDAGGTPKPDDKLTVFTYETGVTRSIGTVSFSDLPAGWSGTPVLHDDGAGTIYVDGLQGPITGTLIQLF